MVAGTHIVGTLVAMSVAKKAALYTAGRLYGFPRIYGRIMRATRAAGASPRSRRTVAHSLQTTFRLPNKLLEHFARWRVGGAASVAGRNKAL
jgi:hypothetical protein